MYRYIPSIQLSLFCITLLLCICPILHDGAIFPPVFCIMVTVCTDCLALWGLFVFFSRVLSLCPDMNYIGTLIYYIFSFPQIIFIYIHTHPQIPIPLCCPRVSISPQTRTDSIRTTHFISLIHSSQFRCTEQNRAEPPAKSRSSSCRCRYKSSCFFRYVVGLSSAVIGSGVHVATVCSDWLWCAHDCGGSSGRCLAEFVKHL